MKVKCIVTGAMLGVAAGAVVGSLTAPKRRRIRCASLKAAKAVAALTDSVLSIVGL